MKQLNRKEYESLLKTFVAAATHDKPLLVLGQAGLGKKGAIKKLFEFMYDEFDEVNLDDEQQFTVPGWVNEKHPLAMVDYRKMDVGEQEMAYVQYLQANLGKAIVVLAENGRIAEVPEWCEVIELV